MVQGQTEVVRDLGTGPMLTTLNFLAIGKADGSAKGHFYFNFRALDIIVEGTVSCVSIAGNQGWVGANITRIETDDPADQALVGTEVYWRALDNGKGNSTTPDQITSLLFAIPGGPITSESWCRDQPQLAPARNLADGDVKVKDK